MKGARLLAVSKSDKVASKRGRSTDLIDKRNRMIFVMFNFYKNSDLKYEAILKRLSQVFFISEVTLSDILFSNQDAIKKLQSERIDLEKEYPQIKWKILYEEPRN